MASISGTGGRDTLVGTAGPDTLLGLAGDDLLVGLDAADSLVGGDGDDTLVGGAGDDRIDGGDGRDLIDGGPGADRIDGGNQLDIVTFASAAGPVEVDAAAGVGLAGDAAGDVYISVRAFIGSEFDDVLTGGAGADTFYGQGGDDRLTGGAGRDWLYGGAGHDWLSGGDGVDWIHGGAGDDLIEGGAGNDVLTGSLGADVVRGGDGNDRIEGGEGNDLIDGGAGADTMLGSGGDDTFVSLTDGDTVDGGIGGFDRLVFDDPARVRVTYDALDPQAGVVDLLGADGEVTGQVRFSNIERFVPCFTPGALVETARGPVAVEHVQVGDRVLTRDDGWQPVVWTGRRDLTAAETRADPALVPVRIPAGAFGDGCPLRDMVVSRQHRMLLADPVVQMLTGETEGLVRAADLIGRRGVAPAAPGAVSYLHILCDGHQVLRVDDAWTESFQPGARTLGGLDEAVRAEVLSLFPALRRDPGAYAAARRTLRAHEARLAMA